MAKIVDITDKLSFEENPSIAVKGQKLEVNADATTVLKLMGIMGEGDAVQPSDVIKMYELMFNEKDRNKLEKMKLSFKDFQTVVYAAIGMITGEGEQGE